MPRKPWCGVLLAANGVSPDTVSLLFELTRDGGRRVEIFLSRARFESIVLDLIEGQQIFLPSDNYSTTNRQRLQALLNRSK